MHAKKTHEHHHEPDINNMAVIATLHCITGCAIGEIVGLVLGTILGLSNAYNIALAVVLSFIFGYTLSMLPLLQGGMTFRKALSIILVADTLSILTMEIVDNSVMAAVPNAMNANLVNPLYWITMPISLLAAFAAAIPVNRYLLKRGRGHALVHELPSLD